MGHWTSPLVPVRNCDTLNLDSMDVNGGGVAILTIVHLILTKNRMLEPSPVDLLTFPIAPL